ncbi:leucine-rich repeat domain-containing protein [Porphyromonas crevioricanis]|nr:leucine-rich repeat domain-containing protein [Porphyromonas crevioricanis]
MSAKYFLLLGFVLFCLPISVQAQEYHVTKAGTLSQVVGPEVRDLSHIRITGFLNAQDLAFIRSLARYPRSQSKLRHLDIEDAVLENNTIPKEGFFKCCMESYKLPKTLKNIEQCAFQWNHDLKELRIPEGVTHVAKRAFYWNRNLEKIWLPESLTEFSESMLGGGCIALREVHWSKNLKRIGDSAFWGCENLHIKELPNTLEIIEETAFEGTLMDEIVVPKSVKKMQGAFWGAKKLRKVDIQAPLTEIEKNTFYWCEELREVKLPEGVTRIGNGAFFWNLELKDITLPESVTHIEDDAFNSAPFDSIVIPPKVVLIGREAFWNNRNLKKVYAKPVVPPVTSEPTVIAPNLPFHACNEETVTLYVPKGSAEAYRSSEIFRNFGTIVELDPWQFPQANEQPNRPPVLCKVYGCNGQLVIETPAELSGKAYAVYSLEGSLIQQGILQEGKTFILINEGRYVVCIADVARKILL